MERFRTHYLPRTPAGRIGVGAFLLLFAFTQPPLVFWIANRIEPRIFGAPFIYAYLLVIYFLLIGVLLWARRRDL